MSKRTDRKSIVDAFTWMLSFVLIIWIIEVVNFSLDHRLCVFGILPRSTPHLAGIFLSPLLHYGFTHVLMNTIPLLILGSLLVMRGKRVFVRTTIAIIIVGGLGVWFFGREAYHVGASGLIFGYFGFLVGAAWYERSLFALLAAIVAIGLYGSTLLTGLFPLNSYISWEGHLAGLIAGLIAAKIFQKRI